MVSGKSYSSMHHILHAGVHNCVRSLGIREREGRLAPDWIEKRREKGDGYIKLDQH